MMSMLAAVGRRARAHSAPELGRMLQGACYITIAYLSGMRASELEHLRRGAVRALFGNNFHPQGGLSQLPSDLRNVLTANYSLTTVDKQYNGIQYSSLTTSMVSGTTTSSASRIRMPTPSNSCVADRDVRVRRCDHLCVCACRWFAAGGISICHLHETTEFLGELAPEMSTVIGSGWTLSGGPTRRSPTWAQS
ncbi:hypothetical protein AB0N05_24790 [Nocardia sp. NPDC051030]|uniref:hypothetical protein n=1 Tax=Nocardia sp. NPDC051030 TaxID=3155162 RepID=UPI003426C978